MLSTVKKLQATIPAACSRRNAHQVLIARRGAGSSPWRRSVLDVGRSTPSDHPSMPAQQRRRADVRRYPSRHTNLQLTGLGIVSVPYARSSWWRRGLRPLRRGQLLGRVAPDPSPRAAGRPGWRPLGCIWIPLLLAPGLHGRRAQRGSRLAATAPARLLDEAVRGDDCFVGKPRSRHGSQALPWVMSHLSAVPRGVQHC
jgi:hypothetical protein